LHVELIVEMHVEVVRRSVREATHVTERGDPEMCIGGYRDREPADEAAR
jgi:hypothetical protein